jgi:hypothetical protein
MAPLALSRISSVRPGLPSALLDECWSPAKKKIQRPIPNKNLTPKTMFIDI